MFTIPINIKIQSHVHTQHREKNKRKRDKKTRPCSIIIIIIIIIIMATDSTRLRTAKSYIAFFTTLDTSLLAPLLSDEKFEHIMAPASLAIPSLNKSQFLAHSVDLGKIMSGFPVVAKEYLESESANSVVVWATSRTEFREVVLKQEGGNDGWEYEGEYMFVLTMDASGKRIVRVVEMLDSLKTDKELRPLMRKARERLAAASG